MDPVGWDSVIKDSVIKDSVSRDSVTVSSAHLHFEGLVAAKNPRLPLIPKKIPHLVKINNLFFLRP